MALWTDIIDPAELTGYARASLEDYEQSKGTLARWLPNRTVQDVVARFVAGSTGLVDVAPFRAYDAEIEIGKQPSGKRVTLELPALGLNIPVSEYEQLRARGGNVSEVQALISIQNTTRRVVAAIADSIERMRGIVLETGIATIDQDNFQSADSFGRSGTHTVTAATLWSVSTSAPLDYLQTLYDLYVNDNGEAPGSLLMSTKVFRAMAKTAELATQLVNGSSRPATLAEAQATVEGAGLPPITLYDRSVSVAGTTTRAFSDKKVALLPAPVDPNDEGGSQLGGTFWGRTLSSTEPGWGIEDADQAGVVAGVWRNDKPPMGIEVIGDGIGLPVLANADLSIVATVLA